MKLEYMAGFQNTHSTEALKGALPKNQNSPQNVKYGLYAEQFSTSAFTAPRSENFKSWLYRIRPSVLHSDFKPYVGNKNFITHKSEHATTPNQLRWNPLSKPKKKTDFVDGLITYCESGSPQTQSGSAVHMFSINDSMTKRFFMTADAEMLIVVQSGELLLKTEFGYLTITPTEIAVVPKGVKFQVILRSDTSSGYVCENFGRTLRLPDLGPIGANGLANARHFLAPVAAYEEVDKAFTFIQKFNGTLWSATQPHSPFDVVAWYGNTYPYKYDLKLFNTINTVSFDHPDPSIFTVLTSPSSDLGTANMDFVIFPPRWMVAENTFRPPYFHRNCMSEFMGLITGEYDAKQEGFLPGGASLHNAFSAHGPDQQTFETASKATLKPQKIDNTMAFMFESRYIYHVSKGAMNSPLRQKNYQDCWKGLKSNFKK